MDKLVLDRQIKDAVAAHGAWKSKLNQAVQTGVLPKPARDIAVDDQCAFGKWLHGLRGDSTVSGSAEYGAVVRAHAAFHQLAGAIAAKVETGARDAAEDELSGPRFAQSSAELERAMNRWRLSI
ncbi:CZB domain-containing protein [Pseudooceanicola sp. 200-1SW]|uniref:CZB domain-containing protein n=1 Tax=Pseudooceanicola sp. 200-1SW TaxID=3425949 RepID=UPI003D7F87AA